MVKLGDVVATAAVSDFMESDEKIEKEAMEFLRRHANGDWGDMSEVDKEDNDQCLLNGSRLHSSYTFSTGETLWIMTEADRRVTTLLFPSDY